MDYYEELGVHRVAQVEEIHRAWRNLARLLHPDQQQEEGLRLLAEKQMKRLNEICAVLTDPVERLRYDRSLIHALPAPRPAAGQRPNWMLAARPNWILAAALTVIAITGAVIYPRHTTKHAVPREPANVAGPTAVSTPKPARRRTARPDPPAPLERQPEPAPARVLAISVEPPPDISAASPNPPPPPALVTVDALPAAALPRPAAEEPAPAPGIAGAWFYAQPKTSPGAVLLYPPEFIEVFITESAGTIHGRYRARYKVGDRPISGDVQFFFEGRRQDGPVVLVWTGPEGALGEIRLKLLPDDTLQVNWHATEFGRSVGLVSGAAILTRRRDL